MSYRHVVFIRHGESEANVKSFDELIVSPTRFAEMELTKKGRGQAEQAREEIIKSIGGEPQLMFSSNMTRAIQTALIMFPKTKLIIDSRIREHSWGVWEILSRTDIEASMPWEIQALNKLGKYWYRPTGGENIPDVELRCRSFLRDLFHIEKDKIAVFGHGIQILIVESIITSLLPNQVEKRIEENIYLKNCQPMYCLQDTARIDSRYGLVISS